MKRTLILATLLITSTLISCGHKKGPAVQVATDDTNPHYVRRVNADTVIVFVHGIFGGAVGTWTNPQTGAYWPQLLVADPTFKDTDVYVYSYQSPYAGSSNSIDELIENMRLVLSNDEVFTKHKNVVLLCHSMGGLIVRGFLKRYQEKAPQVPLIYFFSTPTSGAHIANLAKLLSDNPQLRGMLPANSDDYVASLQRDWRALPFHVNSHCAYETLDTYGIRIVDEQSASALCDGPVDPLAANHIDIVKPKDESSLSYIAFKDAFKTVKYANPPPERTSVTGTVRTARSVGVDCGQVRDATAAIPPPIELKPEQTVIEAIASLQEASNLKEQFVESKGLVNQIAKVHYRLVGLDRPPSGECPSQGFGIILVTFIVSQPRSMITAGFTPIGGSDLVLALSGRSGTLSILDSTRIPSIDGLAAASDTLLYRGSIALKGAAERPDGSHGPSSQFDYQQGGLPARNASGYAKAPLKAPSAITKADKPN
jgi:pimeloyl-ACP methyl ester carboxylesterase